ncbi:transketolase [Streptomyces brasiliensis]|uniref:Transketolase, N-terminal subunit n=1 Tax=Streptomyces brasiliensis TaxID=1954 RepID=A0A917KX23_9ACTN|nr:transketolase [Streptomyces brasiliensis]GGJ29001.1 transketolase, N-terminal subunit [Streptomyces brasiliensis]
MTAVQTAPGPLELDEPAARIYVELSERLRKASPSEAAPELARISTRIRRDILTTIQAAGMGHVGGDLSVTDLMVTAIWGSLRLNPFQPDDPQRDRFVLSKGHCAAALYSTLASCGFFPQHRLTDFMGPLSPLNGHPNRVKVPGVETNTGPLGHGFPVATGCALGGKLRGEPWRTVVVLGDGEIQEGSNWEAAMTAAHYGLENLTAVVDRNQLQQGARTEETKGLEPLDQKWASFGWEVRVIDGHDHQAIKEAFGPSTTGRPVAVIANTIKGKGISFMEDRVEWHHKVPTDEQVRLALEELSR